MTSYYICKYNIEIVLAIIDLFQVFFCWNLAGIFKLIVIYQYILSKIHCQAIKLMKKLVNEIEHP